MNTSTRLAVVAVAMSMVWVFAGSASAKPEFAKSTGKKCADCHTAAGKPELNDAGKAFKKCFDTKKDAAACK